MTSTHSEYGSWQSPISAEMVARSGTGSSALPREIHIDGDFVYWVELRPQEGGRYVIVEWHPGGTKRTVTPQGFSVQSRVHEYGGGVFCVRNGTIVFINDENQRLHRQIAGCSPEAITPSPQRRRAVRYADGSFSPDGDWMVWVRERHESGGGIHNEIVLIPADGSSAPRIFIEGHDFFSNPRFSPDGKTLSWLSWDHPHMPWDETELWSAPFNPDTSTLGAPTRVAGGESTSIFQPEWGPDGLLYFISDRTDWWNLYRQTPAGELENICPIEAEFGYPQWLFGFTKYTFLASNAILTSYKIAGQAKLGLINPVERTIHEIDNPFTTFENPSMRADNSQTAWFFAGSPGHLPALCRFRMEDGKAEKALDLFDTELDPAQISRPQQIEFENRLGSKSYAFFYPPNNDRFEAPPDQKPPLIVMSHGGPTSSARPHLDLETQYWTSRGYAVADVDYSGSVGYGRAYRDRLKYRMGQVDVDDCIQAARHLVKAGVVDERQLLIRGSSAGGYVTLCALTFYDLFTAGSCYYGIADLEILAQHTHKFEAHYLDTLVGPYPERKDLYVERSPIHHSDDLNCPLILMQGLEDDVVSPEQSAIMVAALDRQGIAHAYLTFENEAHGFKRTETIRTALETEDYFFRYVLGIPLDDAVAAVKIKHR
ncbi:MAG: prolyl oligopeptidase family serine peptidase [Anaerolineales bacterium]|nr:prolyl oligopeptidase family serine peptidase [Anaerolineales bacterium]